MKREVAWMIGAWLGLLLLLALTISVAFLPIGPAKIWLGYAIATAKAGLILWFFMDLRRENGIARLAALAGFAWMAFLLILTAADYMTRTWL